MTDANRPELGREIATTRDGMDITRGYTGPLLLPNDSVLRNRGGYDLQIYEHVYSDDEVKATFSQRQLAVTQCEWQVEAGGDRRVDKQAAEWLRQQLHAVGWDNITTKMHNVVFYGYAVAELIYKPDGAYIGIDKIKVRNRRRFRYDQDCELRLLTQHNMFDGVLCDRKYFWDFNAGADNDDEPYGLGLAHWLYWPTLFKRNGLKFWLIFLEKFGMPTAKGTYDANATAEEKGKLLAAARAIQTDSGIIMPEGMKLELIEAARSGTADYKTLVDVMNAAIQKVVLGQTASTQGTPGRLGNDDLQADVRKDLIKADADLICESFNKGPVRQLMLWNFPAAQPPRVFRVTEEPEDLDTRAKRDKDVSDLGFKPSLKYINDTYGGEWTEKQSTPPPELLPPSGASAVDGADFAQAGEAVIALLRRHGLHFAESANAQDPSAPMADQVDRRLRPVGEHWIDQVRSLVDQAESLEDLDAKLLALAPDLSLDEYAEVFAQAMTAATLAGRYDIQQG
ncbi:DUF935 family protein [Lysobacter yananisis]|uniref:DUF935 family protein n=1 Tax=Lysobacter yananisis TaxID=1003114 RepID=A0ABY9P937_9GAMM|nr:DUF935 family protein [Lysobacter yananisis]WMT03315.1 DUF935 family protein [Lysobacter yananisis]